MSLLLTQLWHYSGSGIPAELFFDTKAAETLSLIFERYQCINSEATKKLSKKDRQLMERVGAYIGNHYADNLNNELLVKISYMRTAKLKSIFHSHFGCAISEYIQAVRIDQAKHLLTYTVLPIVQVAQAMGYSNADASRLLAF